MAFFLGCNSYYTTGVARSQLLLLHTRSRHLDRALAWVKWVGKSSCQGAVRGLKATMLVHFGCVANAGRRKVSLLGLCLAEQIMTARVVHSNMPRAWHGREFGAHVSNAVTRPAIDKPSRGIQRAPTANCCHRWRIPLALISNSTVV